MKSIVTIGGGSGQAPLLRHLKAYRLQITALVSMVDDGGSTGVLRKQLGIFPVGDMRQCLTALAQEKNSLIELFSYRFTSGALAGHTVGNLVLAGLMLKTKNVLRALRIASRWLDTKGTVLPSSLQPATLYARLENGRTISGETNIDVPQHNPNLRIDNISIRPHVRALPQAVRAIVNADVVILTIGDLYTSVIPNILVPGIAKALRTTKAHVIYTCNRVWKRGETNRFSALEYVKTIDRYIGARRIDTVIVDRTIQHDHTTRNLVRYDRQALQKYGIKVIEASLCGRSRREIDGKKLATLLASVCQRSL